jgi:hypothetical protein
MQDAGPFGGIGYPCRVGGSNEAKATTGSDSLNGLDGACADGYRGRRLPDWNSNNGRHSGVLYR